MQMYYFNNIWIKCIINLVQFYVRKWDDFLYDDNQVNNGAPYMREQIQINADQCEFDAHAAQLLLCLNALRYERASILWCIHALKAEFILESVFLALCRMCISLFRMHILVCEVEKWKCACEKTMKKCLHC